MTFREAVPTGGGAHVVTAGETIDLIAQRHGHFWETIWNDPANAALKEARGERNVLLPGDRVTIPPLRPKTERCATGRVHRFRRRGVPSRISFVLRTPGGRTFAGTPYRLTLGDRTYEGKSDDAGLIERYVLASTTTAELELWPGIEGLPEPLTWTFRLGTLLPADSIAGMQQRLRRLGFDCGTGDGVLDLATRDAIAAFQRARLIEETGEPDAATVAALLEANGC